MTLTITERDKKLLMILGWILLIFGVGFMVIRPLIADNRQLQTDIETARIEQQEKQQKVMLLASLQASRQALQENVEKKQKIYYEEMESTDIDKLFTFQSLGHNLIVNNLSIGMPVPGGYCNLGVYTADASLEQYAMKFTGIYTANVSLTLTGSREDLQEMLDECISMEPKMRVVSFQWQSLGSKTTVVSDDGEETKVYEGDCRMTIALELYMYEKLEDYLQTLHPEEEETEKEETTQEQSQEAIMKDAGIN